MLLLLIGVYSVTVLLCFLIFSYGASNLDWYDEIYEFSDVDDTLIVNFCSEPIEDHEYFLLIPTLSFYAMADFIPLLIMLLNDGNQGCSLFMLVVVLFTLLPSTLVVVALIGKMYLFDKTTYRVEFMSSIINHPVWEILYNLYFVMTTCSPLLIIPLAVLYPVEECSSEEDYYFLALIFGLTYTPLYLIFRDRFTSFLSFSEGSYPDRINILQGLLIVQISLLFAASLSLVERSPEVTFIKYSILTLGSFSYKLGVLFNLNGTRLFSYDDYLNNFSRNGLYNHRNRGLPCDIDTSTPSSFRLYSIWESLSKRFEIL